MINYGQKVIQRGGDAEDTWLDEGLSGFAEELGGRLVPDDRCVDIDCLTQFHRDNLVNAYDYLAQEDGAYLIGPRRPPLPLTEYGATWLFVRWLSDHFAAEPTLGSRFHPGPGAEYADGARRMSPPPPTRRSTGCVGEWQLANYLAGRPDFADVTAGTRYGYTSWNLRDVFASFNQQSPQRFPSPYPVEPDAFAGDGYLRDGVLRAGSGRHVLVQQSAVGPPGSAAHQSRRGRRALARRRAAHRGPPRPVKRMIFLIVVATIFAGYGTAYLASEDVRYVTRAGIEETRILQAREPIAELVADRTTDPAVRHSLRLVLAEPRLRGQAGARCEADLHHVRRRRP